MSRRIHLSALALGLVLAGPAAADPQTNQPHPVAAIDISALTIKSDFTVFMAKDVPEDVRLRALRRLWTLMELPVWCHELCTEPQTHGLRHYASR
jgi:Protein of unknown function (DUF3306)